MSQCEAEAIEKSRLLRTGKNVCRNDKDVQQTEKTIKKIFLFIRSVQIIAMSLVHFCCLAPHGASGLK